MPDLERLQANGSSVVLHEKIARIQKKLVSVMPSDAGCSGRQVVDSENK